MFFQKFPLLYDYFWSTIEASKKLLNTHLNAKLYLVALILCHLFTLSDETSDPEALLHTLVPGLLDCIKSPVMKTRIHLAKAIASTVNLDRYPSLILDIFSMNCTDNNHLNGLLHVLSALIDRNEHIFRLCPLETFLKKLTSLLRAFESHCALNYANSLRIMAKIFYSNKQISQLFGQTLLELVSKAFDSLLVLARTGPCLLEPGCHDLLVNLGETFCFLVQLDLVSEDLRLKVESLIKDKKLEYSFGLIEGFVLFYIFSQKSDLF
jgi:hypothetical protein